MPQERKLFQKLLFALQYFVTLPNVPQTTKDEVLNNIAESFHFIIGRLTEKFVDQSKIEILINNLTKSPNTHNKESIIAEISREISLVLESRESYIIINQFLSDCVIIVSEIPPEQEKSTFLTKLYEIGLTQEIHTQIRQKYDELFGK